MLWRITEGSNFLSMKFDCELVRAFGDSEEIVFDLVTCAVREIERIRVQLNCCPVH